MIAELPHDVQGHVWEMYTEDLHRRIDDRNRRAATRVIDYIGVLCNHDAAARDYLLDWTAHMLQHPDVKPSKGIVLVGREDFGKTMLVHLLCRLIPTLCTNDPRRDVYGRCNTLMESTQLVVIENAERLHIPAVKSIITNPLVTIRGRQATRVVPSAHRTLLIVSELQASLGDRRFYPIHCTEECMNDPETIETLRRIFTSPCLDALREMLLARTVSRVM